jgi:hypothetical protein
VSLVGVDAAKGAVSPMHLKTRPDPDVFGERFQEIVLGDLRKRPKGPFRIGARASYKRRFFGIGERPVSAPKQTGANDPEPTLGGRRKLPVGAEQ